MMDRERGGDIAVPGPALLARDGARPKRDVMHDESGVGFIISLYPFRHFWSKMTDIMYDESGVGALLLALIVRHFWGRMARKTSRRLLSLPRGTQAETRNPNSKP